MSTWLTLTTGGHVVLALLLLVGLPGGSGGADAVPGPEVTSWLPLVHGSLARLEVERAVYALPGTATVLVHVRLVNLGSAPLWVDLGSDQGVHPQQWGSCPPGGRSLVDERRAVRPVLDARRRGQVIAAIAAGSLCRVPGLGAIDRFCAFAGGDTPSIARADGPWVYISIAGGSLVTDGSQVEDLSLEGPDLASHDLILRAPVQPIVILPLPELRGAQAGR